MDIYQVYALKSIVDNRIYVGFTSNLDRRLVEHNSGKTKSSKGYRPWVLLYSEEVLGSENARNREKYIKPGVGKEFLKSL
jgi:putative endonuclease